MDKNHNILALDYHLNKIENMSPLSTGFKKSNHNIIERNIIERILIKELIDLKIDKENIFILNH